jgi:hypothetical protein
MKHLTLDELRQLAEVHTAKPALSRDERLTRWAELLEAQPERNLRTLHGTEFQAGESRDSMRAAESPISVAFADPVLRAEGMKDDTYGEARRFFELTDWQLHDVLCHCHYGAAISAGAAARRVRASVGTTGGPSLFARMRHIVGA